MISVVTPAHNEAALISGCLASVAAAARHVNVPVEHLVVLNRCTDATERIARSANARIVVEDSRNLSRIRNAGASAAQGDILITIDADSRMTENMLQEVVAKLATGRFIGGGVRVWPERISLGIFCSVMLILPVVFWQRVSAGMFWCYKADFDAIGGFNEALISVEDLEFARRLRRYGKQKGKRFGTIRRAHMVTSCRKFDEFGDWYLVRKPWVVFRIFHCDQKTVDEFYYDFRTTQNARASETAGGLESPAPDPAGKSGE